MSFYCLSAVIGFKTDSTRGHFARVVKTEARAQSYTRRAGLMRVKTEGMGLKHANYSSRADLALVQAQRSCWSGDLREPWVVETSFVEKSWCRLITNFRTTHHQTGEQRWSCVSIRWENSADRKTAGWLLQDYRTSWASISFRNTRPALPGDRLTYQQHRCCIIANTTSIRLKALKCP